MKYSRLKSVAFAGAVLVLAAGFAVGQTKKPESAASVLAAALKTAKAEKKNVFMEFGASWCGWCKKLDAMIESKEVGTLFHSSYVIAHLTIQESPDKVALENPGAEEMASEAGAKGAGVPVFIFFDGDGKRLATSMAMPNGGNIGHPATPEEIEAFDRLLEKTALHMTAADRQQVKNYLIAENKK